MLQVYLPIADVSVNIATLLIISVVVGFFAGLLGIGGGFLITPILIFLGIPPIYAVANGANNILAASVSGTLAHWFKDQLDIKMGLLILSGGLFGSIGGMIMFTFFLSQGSLNNIISIMYCVLLSGIGISMLIESLIEIRRIQLNRFIRTKLHKHYWLHNLPFKMPLKGSRTGSCRPRCLLATPAYAAEVAAKLIVHTNSFLICCKTVQKRGAKLTKT